MISEVLSLTCFVFACLLLGIYTVGGLIYIYVNLYDKIKELKYNERNDKK